MEVMLTCFLMWLGRRVAARAIVLSFQIGQILRTFTIFPTTSTAGRHLRLERDYNYHTAFWAYYVIMQKVYKFTASMFTLQFLFYLGL